MKIDKITLCDFRQYFGANTIDFKTTGEKNIILIGGKNGYGKTNLLMSLVWCLYGEDISKIDDNFRKEIQKEGNYSKFLKSSLNWDAAKNGQENFSVEIVFSEIEFPDNFKIARKPKCSIKRTFNTSNGSEVFEIELDGKSSYLVSDEDKKTFVNDYLVPTDAAKFIFFDAEKIGSWAELSFKEEGSILNDALGKILGLDIYESLIDDLEIYCDTLRKESATHTVKQQINAVEKGIEFNLEEIEKKERELLEKENQQQDLKLKMSEYELFLARNSFATLSTKNVEELYITRKNLGDKEKEFEIQFNELSELMPFAIAAGKLEEVSEHLGKQEQSALLTERRIELMEKNEVLLEKLFNNPPFPLDGDISFSKKIFYAEKAKKIIDEVFGSIDLSELEFEHDLNRSDYQLIEETYSYLQKQSKDVFEQTIENFIRIKDEIILTDQLIRRIESDQQDEEVIKYTNNKNDIERKIEKLIEDKAVLQNQVSQLRKTNDADNQRLQVLLKRVEVSQQKSRKLEKANQYIKVIRDFIIHQKSKKRIILESAIFEEMQKLMHKLQDIEGDNFVAAVKAENLPENDGLKITLLDKDGKVRHKESLSQGEKQIYISSLVKAIVSLSIQEFPIFIDTPLGRLDDEHIKNVLMNYYPDLASQVVLMATNNEIPPSRYKLMKQNVSQSYLLVNLKNRTSFKTGYFQSYEN